MKKDWTDTIRDKLSESAVTPPEGLWADISSSLDATVPTKKHAHQRPVWRWIAAAACLAAIVVCGLLIYNAPTAYDKYIGQTAEVDNHVTTPGANTPDKTSWMQQDLDPQVLANVHTKNTAVGSQDEVVPLSLSNVETPVDSQGEDATLSQSSIETTVDSQGEDAPLSQSSIETTVDSQGEDAPLSQSVPSAHMRHTYASEHHIPKTSTSHLRNRLSVSLYASNLNLPNINFGKGEAFEDIPVQAPLDPDQDYTIPGIPSGSDPTDSPSDPNIPPVSPRKNMRHNQPIRYGLSVRIPLSQKVSIGTGLTYSRLTSEITVTGDQNILQYQIDQTLHYIGVPLSLDYALLSHYPFNFYLSAGVMAERCIYGEARRNISSTTERVSEPGLQMSVFAGAGVQINLSDHVALYAEPLGTFYIDNHSNLTNIYKDRPLNIDLRLGLRYTLK